MADPYAGITEADPSMVAKLAAVLELRAADPGMARIRNSFLDALPPRAGVDVVELGCGTGAVCRALAARPGLASVRGVDPSPLLLERARALGGHLPRLSFVEGDGRACGLPDACCDIAIAFTTLCHVPGPERMLAEMRRILRAGGTIAIFDGDYIARTVALGRNDPLQCCIDEGIASTCHSPWLARGLAPMLRALGFEDVNVASHAYAAGNQPDYMLTVLDRGADALAAAGLAGAGLAAALKAEARERFAAGRFFGQIGFFHAIGRKPE